MQKKIIVQNKFGVIKKQFGSKFFYQKFFLIKTGQTLPWEMLPEIHRDS